MIQASGEGKREEPTEEVKGSVVNIARQLRDAFERNDRNISALGVHQPIDEKEVVDQHKDAVLGYRWAVNEAVVWKEEIARKIDNLLPNRP
jgi:hypothetical protein